MKRYYNRFFSCLLIVTFLNVYDGKTFAIEFHLRISEFYISIYIKPIIKWWLGSSQPHPSLSYPSHQHLNIFLQVRIYKEDFETERKDREKSQTEKQLLEDRLKSMNQEIQALTEQVRINEHDFRQERRDKVKLQRQMVQVNAELVSNYKPHLI